MQSMWKDVAVVNFKVVSRNFIRKSENNSEPGSMGLGTPKYGARGVSRSAKLTLGFFINSSTSPNSTAALPKLMWPWNFFGFEIYCQEANTAK